MSVFADIRARPGRRIFEGITGRVVEGDRITLGLVDLEPGAIATLHNHPHEQLGLVLEGSVTFVAGGEERELHPGDTWCLRSNLEHQVTAGPEGAVVLDIFSPIRDDWGDLGQVEGTSRWMRTD